jgi:hypothetical protein
MTQPRHGSTVTAQHSRATVSNFWNRVPGTNLAGGTVNRLGDATRIGDLPMRGAFSMGQVGVREMVMGEGPDPDGGPIAVAFSVLIMVIAIVWAWLIGGFNSLTNEREVVCTIISKHLSDPPSIPSGPFDVPDFEAESEPQSVKTSECGTINVKQGFWLY